MGEVVGSIDVAQIVLYVFWIFFAGLLWYLRQEDRREGYPLEDDVTGAYNKSPWLFMAQPKTFVLPHGQGTAAAPNFKRDAQPEGVRRTSVAPGSPMVPTGDGMKSAIGPGAYAQRLDIADLTAHGDHRIVPMSIDGAYSLSADDPDPIGMKVVGTDRRSAGVVKDVWIDRAEHLIRYYEVEIGADDTEKHVLLPANFAMLQKSRAHGQHLHVHAVQSHHFADVPGTASAQSITRLEEEKIMAYYGGGLLYASKRRGESWL